MKARPTCPYLARAHLARAALLLLPLTLAACTGTDETLPPLRLALLVNGGSTLRLLTPGTDGGPATADTTQTLNGGVNLNTLPDSRSLALTQAAGVDRRDPSGAVLSSFAALPFTPCLKSTVTNVARDRLLTFSDCPNDAQRLALYRTDGTLVWTALLPTFLTPAGTDVPPIRTALLGEVAVVARPRLEGGSETLRVAAASAGSAVAAVSSPRPTAAIRDLAAYSPAGAGARIVAATDTGIQPLTEAGELDAPNALKAFGETRYDRVWTSGTSALITAWRDNRRSNTYSEPLRLWDGRLNTAATVENFSDLRDVVLSPDGLLYALSATTLTRADTLLGLSRGYWSTRTVLSGLNDARALTWLVP